MEQSDQTAKEESTDVCGNDGRADGGSCQDRDQHSCDSADHRQDHRKNCDGLEALEDAHGGYRREDHESGDHQRADKVHCHDDHHSDHDSDEQVIAFGTGSCGGGEAFIKGDGEDLVVEQQKDNDHDGGNDRAGNNIAQGEREKSR